MTPGRNEDTLQLLDRFMETMAALMRGIREERVSDGDRQQILETQDLGQQLSDQIHIGHTANGLIPVVEALTDKLQVSPTLWLNSHSDSPDQPRAEELHEEARVAFYTLRAHLFPDGKVWTA